jgi:hypothetical protein
VSALPREPCLLRWEAWHRLVCLAIPSCLWAQGPFQIDGYIQGRFTNREGAADRLEIRRARLVVFGDPLPNFSYNLQADLVHAPYLLDASLTWKISESFRVTGGQFKIPFSAESLAPDNRDIPIERARAVNSLAPGRDEGVQGRDSGVEASGRIGRFEYTAALLRGQLIVHSPAVHYRAAAGRFLVHTLRGLTMGGDWYGSYSVSSGPPKRRVDAEGGYEHGPLHLAAEQIFARDGALQRRGGYGVASWRLNRHWEPLARADWLTTNIAKPNTTSVVYVAGMNFYWRKYLKVGINTGAQHDQGPRRFSSVFLAQTTLSF